MRIHQILFVLSCASSSVVLAGTIDCRNPMHTAEFNQCAEMTYKIADEKLNAAYRKVLENLSVAERQTLVMLQRDWLKTRDAQCELEAKPTKAGMIWYQVNYECKTRLTVNRTADIEAALKYR